MTDTLTLHAADARAEISPHGAHVLSWQCRGRERLFMSPLTRIQPGAAIRGGIPVVFPQFSERGPGPKHGFARIQTWQAQADARAPDRLQFQLSDNEHTRQGWPHRFSAEIDVRLSEDRLTTTLSVANTDKTPFQFAAALHTYLWVDDLAGVRLEGLESQAYLDSVRQGVETAAEGRPVRFEGELDRIYPGAAGPFRLVDGEHHLRIESTGFIDTVVWNPGAELAARMADLGPGPHAHFVCVEAAVVLEPVQLAPGQRWQGSQTLIA